MGPKDFFNDLIIQVTPGPIRIYFYPEIGDVENVWGTSYNYAFCRNNEILLQLASTEERFVGLESADGVKLVMILGESPISHF